MEFYRRGFYQRQWKSVIAAGATLATASCSTPAPSVLETFTARGSLVDYSTPGNYVSGSQCEGGRYDLTDGVHVTDSTNTTLGNGPLELRSQQWGMCAYDFEITVDQSDQDHYEVSFGKAITETYTREDLEGRVSKVVGRGKAKQETRPQSGATSPSSASPPSGSGGSSAASDSIGETAFLRALRSNGLIFDEETGAVQSGKYACSLLASGDSFIEAGSIVRNRLGISASQAGTIVGAAIPAFCPGHISKLPR
ncbi:DUF732 domain-containing protein [Dietzia maris]